MIKRLFSAIANFAKRRPSLFIVIVLVLIVGFFFVTYEALHLTSTPKFCGICHQDAASGPGGEYHTWEKNVHAAANVTCIDCHGKPGFFGYMRAKMGGLYDLYAQIVLSPEEKKEVLTKGATDIDYAGELVPNNWCLFCHSDEVNKTTRENTFMSFLGVKMRNMDKVVNPEFRQKNGLPDLFTEPTFGVDPNHTTHVKDLGLSCMNCHLNVAHGNEFYNKTKMDTCFTCHDAERDKKEGLKMPENDDCAACHQLVVKEQEGAFLEDKGIEAMEWYMPSLTGECSSCHIDAETPPTPQNCVDCHEESYGEMMVDFQTSFTEQKDALTPVWQELYRLQGIMTDEERAKFHQLNYFYNLIDMDGSKGIHNTDLMSSVFEKANELAEDLKDSLAQR